MKSLKNLLSKKSVAGLKTVSMRPADEKSIESVFFKVLANNLPNIGRADINYFQYRENKIFLKAAHPAIASEIWKKRERLKDEINGIMQSEDVEEIRIK